jgi:hypothetical protein
MAVDLVQQSIEVPTGTTARHFIFTGSLGLDADSLKPFLVTTTHQVVYNVSFPLPLPSPLGWTTQEHFAPPSPIPKNTLYLASFAALMAPSGQASGPNPGNDMGGWAVGPGNFNQDSAPDCRVGVSSSNSLEFSFTYREFQGLVLPMRLSYLTHVIGTPPSETQAITTPDHPTA